MGSFFELRHDPLVLSGMARASADVAEAELVQDLAHRALVIGDTEALGDEALQVDPAPAHDAMHGPIRADLDDLGQFGPLLEAERRDGRPLDQVSFSPSGPRSLKRWTQSRRVWRSMPPIRAASVRLIPSRMAARDNRRRLWLAFFVVAARRRSSPAEKSDLIRTAAGMAQVLPTPWNQLAHEEGSPCESKRKPAGIKYCLRRQPRVLRIRLPARHPLLFGD